MFPRGQSKMGSWQKAFIKRLDGTANNEKQLHTQNKEVQDTKVAELNLY